jgi:hypothetical protein
MVQPFAGVVCTASRSSGKRSPVATISFDDAVDTVPPSTLVSVLAMFSAVITSVETPARTRLVLHSFQSLLFLRSARAQSHP